MTEILFFFFALNLSCLGHSHVGLLFDNENQRKIGSWHNCTWLPHMVDVFMMSLHGWDFSGHSWVLGFRYFSESNKNSFEMHFDCDFSPFRTQTLTWSHPYQSEGSNRAGFYFCTRHRKILGQNGSAHGCVLVPRFFLTVQFSSSSNWVMGRTWGMIQQRSSASRSYRRPLWIVLA